MKINTFFTDAYWLDICHNNGYGQLPIPTRRDDEISDLIQSWMKLDESSREDAASCVTEKQRFTLLAYSERMASLAVRESKPNLIFFGLVANGLDGWRFDWRDNLLILSLHYNSAKRLGVSPEQLFTQAASYLDRKIQDEFKAFLLRKPEDQSLASMGYEEDKDDGGFRYKRAW